MSEPMDTHNELLIRILQDARKSERRRMLEQFRKVVEAFGEILENFPSSYISDDKYDELKEIEIKAVALFQEIEKENGQK